MKKLVTLAITLLAGLSLVGCSSQKSQTKYYDQDFISSLEKGLEARWAITDAVDNPTNPPKDALTKSVNAELAQVKGYDNKKFKNNKLHEEAITYLNALDDQKTALKSYDKSNFFDKWNKAYDTRTQMILKINNKYKLKVSDKYKSDLTELTRRGDEVANTSKKSAAIKALIKSIKFKQTKDDGYTYTYDAKVKNNTDYSFKAFGIKVKLMDSQKTVIDTQAVYTDNWDKGQTNQFEFMTDKKFKSYEVVQDYTN